MYFAYGKGHFECILGRFAIAFGRKHLWMVGNIFRKQFQKTFKNISENNTKTQFPFFPKNFKNNFIKRFSENVSNVGNMQWLLFVWCVTVWQMMASKQNLVRSIYMNMKVVFKNSFGFFDENYWEKTRKVFGKVFQNFPDISQNFPKMFSKIFKNIFFHHQNVIVFPKTFGKHLSCTSRCLLLNCISKSSFVIKLNTLTLLYVTLCWSVLAVQKS